MKKFREVLKNKKGFSLVELIVVIVIILVLAATIVPNVTKYVAQAGESNVKNNAATMLTQIQADVADLYAEAVRTGTALDLSKAEDGTPVGNISLGKKVATYKTALDFTKDTDVAGTGYTVDSKFAVDKFVFVDSGHFICWDSANGWYAMDSKTP